MIALKVTALCLFVFFWLRSKTTQQIEVSDIFTLSFLAIYTPGFLFNSDGITQLNNLSLSESATKHAEVGMLAVLGIGAVVYALRWLSASEHMLAISATYLSPQTERRISYAAILATACCFAGLLLSAEFRDFKLNVSRFLTFQFDGLEYRYLRNHGYSGSWVVQNLVERLRFSLFPLLFCLVIHPLIGRKNYLILFIVSILFFITLPASLSKLPAVVFSSYLAILLLLRRPKLLDLGWIFMIALVGTGVVVAVLVLLYTAQYRVSVMAGALDPVRLALERIWGEPYSIIVRYFHVYPDVAPFTGLSGINLVAKVLNLPIRMPDVEVAELTLGPDSGSNPGVFFLGGYAAFGMVGLVTIAGIGFLYLWMLDLIGRRIRLDIFKATYLATVGTNVLFLNQIALQTALVTYGLIFLPLTIALIDKIVSFKHRSLITNGYSDWRREH